MHVCQHLYVYLREGDGKVLERGILGLRLLLIVCMCMYVSICMCMYVYVHVREGDGKVLERGILGLRLPLMHTHTHTHTHRYTDTHIDRKGISSRTCLVGSINPVMHTYTHTQTNTHRYTDTQTHTHADRKTNLCLVGSVNPVGLQGEASVHGGDGGTYAHTHIQIYTYKCS